MAKVDIRRIALQESLADATEDAYEEWAQSVLPIEHWDYPDDYPVISHRNLTQYARPYRRSQQVVVGSRSTAHG